MGHWRAWNFHLRLLILAALQSIVLNRAPHTPSSPSKARLVGTARFASISGHLESPRVALTLYRRKKQLTGSWNNFEGDDFREPWIYAALFYLRLAALAGIESKKERAKIQTYYRKRKALRLTAGNAITGFVVFPVS